MMEALLAAAVLALTGSAVLVGVSTTQMSTVKIDGQSTAERLGRNQMELIFSLPYQEPPATYQAITTPTGYSVVAEAEEWAAGDPTIQKVVVRVIREGYEILMLESLRAK